MKGKICGDSPCGVDRKGVLRKFVTDAAGFAEPEGLSRFVEFVVALQAVLLLTT